MEIYKEFKFDAAHHLPMAEEGHKCRNLHGHTYKVAIYIKGKVDKEKGWVIDYGEIKKAFAPVLNELDHAYLNNIPGLENPTAENLAIWIWDILIPRLPALSKIVVNETDTSGCIYEGE